MNIQDAARDTESVFAHTLGFGRFLNPNWSLEAELNYQNPSKSGQPGLWWSQYGVSADARYHFRDVDAKRSEEHTSELQSLMRISYAVFSLKKKKRRSSLKTYRVRTSHVAT